jgi:hypothetical protein
MPRMHGFEARSGELARSSAHDLPIDLVGSRYGNAANSFRSTGKPEVILEWCQQGLALIENDLCVERPISNEKRASSDRSIAVEKPTYRDECAPMGKISAL